MIKVSKRTARRYYEHGRTVAMLPHKLTYYVSNDSALPSFSWQDDRTKAFDSIVLQQSLLNCNVKNGLYLAYYVGA